MTVFKKAVLGFNHNIKHKDKLYHIQTEDSGVNNPHIITHLFLGGNVVASKKTSYADIVNADNLSQVVRDLMEEQHKEMLRNLVRGAYDQMETTTAYAPGQIVATQKTNEPVKNTPIKSKPKVNPPPLPATAHPPPKATLPPPLPRAASANKQKEDSSAPRESIFGEELISDKSLDEVILSYLAGERDS